MGENKIEELLKDRKYVAQELGHVSRMLKEGLTFEQKGNLTEALAFMYLYCDDDLKDLVISYMNKVSGSNLVLPR